MEFLSPGSLWLLLLALIPVLLYLVRRRSKKVRVSTLVFFKTLAKEHQESAWLRRLKRWLSFLLILLLLVVAVFVLSGLIVRQDDADRYRTVVILLDRSASMGVMDEIGESRLEAAKRVIRERLTKVPDEVGIALIAYDQRPEVVQPRTLKRRELLSRLDTVVIRPIAGRADAAMETAQMIASLEPPTAIWHLSDRLITGGDSEDRAGEVDANAAESDGGGSEVIASSSPELQVQEQSTDTVTKVHELNLALPKVSNAGITAVQLRGVPLEYARYDVFVRIALNHDAPEPVKARLRLAVGGIPSQLRELDLNPGSQSTLTLRINGSRDQLLRISLDADGDDFPLDDEVMLPLPEIRPILAAWIRPDETEDPYTRFALTSMQESGSFELLKGNPSAWPLKTRVDAVIFDGWLPEEWPTDTPAIVLNPPDHVGMLTVKRLAAPVPYDAVRTGNGEHPVLFRVSSSRMAITQTSLFDGRGSLDPLWFAGPDPILSAGEVGGSRVVVMGFSPGLSERLPLTASFPILVGNALYWCVDQENAEDQSKLYRSGELAPVTGSSLTWTENQGRGSRRTNVPLKSGLIEMDRIGVWETDSGLRGASHLLSAEESDLESLRSELAGEADYFAVTNRFAGNLKLWLLCGVAVLLLLESWLFHRHAVY